MSEKSEITNAMKAAASITQSSSWITLNAAQRCDEAGQFEDELFGRIIAQDEAVLALSQMYQLYLAGMNLQNKPIGTMLFLGPTGSGKTRVVEAAAEVLFNDPHAIIKIDCGEFQHSHEISKLIGSPPGYLGHRETLPLLSQENLDRFQTQSKRLTFVLFDEIEKASDALWQLLLGILDKATLRLGDNRRVDFSQCIIVMTSNLGARQMSMETEGKMGFEPIRPAALQTNNRLQKIATEAARRKFSPEFMNRLDKIVVFQTLSNKAIEKILDLELDMLQRRVLESGRGAFVIRSSDQAKEFLLAEGFDRRYGARPLKRAIERHLVIPISNMIATKQLMAGDVLFVDFDETKSELCFKKTIRATVEIGQLDISFAPSNI